MGLVAPPPVHPTHLAFLGTPALSVPPLRALLAAGFDVRLVVTRADKRRGRRGEPTPSPVKEAAGELGLPVTTEVDAVLDAGVDLGVVVAFGRLIRPHVLAALPMVNLHFSLLPRWRGAAPVERALLAGDRETGVDLMAVEEGMDTGPIYARRRLEIGPADTADRLRDRLVGLGTDLLVETLRAGLPEPVAQQGEATYAGKIERDDLALDWRRPADELHRIVRVGGAWTTIGGRVLKVHEAEVVGIGPGGASRQPGTLDGIVVVTGRGGLALRTVQPEGRGRVDATAWRNGARLGPDARLGT
jgi:methionyl-tRNA formyltransferase